MAANTITLDVNGRRGDGVADGTIKPGMAIKLASDGKWDAWTGATGEMGPTVIAVEDANRGKTVSDSYSAGDRVFYIQPLDGDLVAVLLKDGQSVVPGDKLIKETASGLFIKTTGSPEDECFEAQETLAPSGANGLVKAIKI